MKQILQSAFFILILLISIKFLLSILPGQPVEFQSQEQQLVYQKFINQNYFQFVHQMVSGQFGNSFINPNEEVKNLILSSLTQTTQLALPALLIIFILAFLLSASSTIYKYTWFEVFVDEFYSFFLSMPILLFAPLLIYIFAVRLNWFPLAFLEEPRSYILPLIALSARPIARFGILLKEKLIAESEKPYVLVLVSKGLGPYQILFHHLLKSTLMLWTRFIGVIALGIFSGSFLIENLFSISGMGRLFVESLLTRDFPVVSALVFILGSAFIVLNLFLESVQDYHDKN